VCPDGVLSPCVEVTRRGIRDDLLLWKREDSVALDFPAIANLQRERFDRFHPRYSSVCSECDFVHFCKSNCPMRSILDGRSEGPFPYNCKIAKALIPLFLSRADQNEAYLRLVYGDSFMAREECF
jgi:radical SAM protein with 4Fe4S-binding SPASM domain